MRFVLLLMVPAFLACQRDIEISDASYEGRDHFIITTKSSVYYFDKAGGGLSRMLDNNGNDWIAFKKEPWNKVPESAASAFRGIPNAVFQGDDGGCGHPGWDKCESYFEPPNIIRSRSNTGLWEWTWTFHEKYAEWNIVRTDSSRNYWFLYEGPAGGSFSPVDTYRGNSESDKFLWDTPDHMKREYETGNWQWVFFGRANTDIALSLVHMSGDDKTDYFSYMGNNKDLSFSDDGMIVFGFGRSADTKPQLTGSNAFRIAFIYRKAGEEFSFSYISNEINKLIDNSTKSIY